jgi:pimeloyl-ACP methyl ester carboxylesterase
MGGMTELPGLAVRPAAGRTRSVALVLPGGQVSSLTPGSPGQLAARRMRPFAAGLHRAGRTLGLAAWLVCYRHRGWNGEQASPLPDIGWALDEVRRRHGGVPVVLLGHSMGGRAALRMGGDRSVRAVAAFAPWLPDGEPAGQLAGRRVLIAHGSLDRVTSPRASHGYALQAGAAGAEVTWREVCGDTHAMLLRYRTWQRLAVRFTLSALATPAGGSR